MNGQCRRFYIVMPMCNLLEYTDSYSITSGCLRNYCSDEIDDVDLSDNASDGKSFKYKKKIVGETLETTWKSRICRPTRTTASTIFKRKSHYNSQISYQFLDISWFIFYKLLNRVSFTVNRRLRIDRTS